MARFSLKSSFSRNQFLAQLLVVVTPVPQLLPANVNALFLAFL
jgi:hypothetical protein